MPKAADRLEVSFLKLFGGNIFVTLSNLGRDVAIATAFGAGVATDSFFLVISIPVFLIGAGAGAWRSIVVPALARASAAGKAQMKIVAAQLTYRGVIAIALAVGFLAIASSMLAFIDSGSSVYAALGTLGLLVLPMYALAAFTEANQGTLQADRQLFLPNLARCGLPLGLIGGALLFGGAVGISGVIPGGTVGALAGAGLILWLLRRGSLVVSRRPEALPEVLSREIGLNYRALVTATAITYVSPLVGQWMASSQGPGAVSYLGYANRLTTGIIALVTSALAPVLLGFYANRLAASGLPSVQQPFVDLTRACTWVGCLMTLGVWLTSDLLIGIVYLHGEFTVQDAVQVRGLVDVYALTFPLLLAASSSNTLISALSKNRVLVPICAVLVIVNVVGNVVLMNWLGVLGIALSSSVVYALSMLLMNAYLRSTGDLRVSLGEWLQVGFPLLCLAGAAIVPFGLSIRVTPELHGADVAVSVVVLGGFLLLALLANRALVRAYLPRRISRSA